MRARSKLMPLLVGVLFSTLVADAAEWTGGGGDAKWSSVGNWDVEPQVGGAIAFNTAAGGLSVFDLAGFGVSSLAFGAQAGSFTLGGETPLAIAQSLANHSSVAQTVSVPLRLGALDGSFTIDAAGPLALTSTDSYSPLASLVKTGTGEVTLADPLVAAPATVDVQAGTLKLGARNETTLIRYNLEQVDVTEVLLWRNVDLANVFGVDAVATSPSWNEATVPICPFFWVNNGTNATVQIQQFSSDKYNKASCLTLTQRGDDVYAVAVGRRTNKGEKTRYLGTDAISKFAYTGGYYVGQLRPVCYNSVFLTGDFQPVWKGVRLADVTGCTGLMSGKAVTEGVHLAKGYFWSYDAVNDTATVQIQYPDGGYTKVVHVELRQAGDVVEARAIASGNVAGENLLGTDLASRTNFTVASSPTTDGYGVGKLIPLPQAEAEREATLGGLKVASGARLDVNVAHTTPNAVAETGATYLKTIYVEGTGPDGTGALYNSVAGDGEGYSFRNVTLTGDTMVGGGYLGLGSLIANTRAHLTGTDAVFTVANTVFALADADLDVAQIVARNGTLRLAGKLDGTVPGGVRLENGERAELKAVTLAQTIPLTVVEQGTAAIDVTGGASTLVGDLTIAADAEATLATEASLAVRGTTTVNGALTQSGAGGLLLEGTLAGSGTLAGTNVRFTGSSARWAMTADDQGFVAKVDTTGVADVAFLTALKGIDVVFTGTMKQQFVVHPACSLSPVEVAAIDLVVTDANGMPVKGCSLALDGGALVLKICDDTIPRHAYWTNAVGDGDVSNVGNWACTNDFGSAAVSLPTLDSTVHLPNDVVFNCTNGAAILYKEIRFPSSLCGDSDWQGLGTVNITNTVRLNGHKLYLSGMSGSGAIVDGANGYQELEYIESTGKEYIDTKWSPLANDRVECSVNVSSDQGTRPWPYLFGSGANFDLVLGSLAKQFAFVHTSNNSLLYFPQNDLQGRRVDFACQGATATATVDGETTTISYAGNVDLSSDQSLSFYIFQKNTPNAANRLHANWWTAMKLYSFTIISQGNKVREFAPVKRLSDNAIGLLDRVNNVFYGNASGKGGFLAGPIKTIESGGEVHIVVPQGARVSNSMLALSGTVKLVKEGAGTFVASKKNQQYCGGTLIAEGTFEAPDWGINGIYGPDGVTVTVLSNGTFSATAVAHTKRRFILAGGRIHKAATSDTLGSEWFDDVELTADSTMSGVGYGFIGRNFTETKLNLNGHTLTLDICNGSNTSCFDLCNLTVTGGGCIHAIHGGYVRLGGNGGSGVTAPTTTFWTDAPVIGKSASTFLNYKDSSTSTLNQDSAPITVLGRFTPDTNWQSTILADGATLDLSALDQPIATTCPFTGPSAHTCSLAFATNAVITVDLGARTVAAHTPVVSWPLETPPDNLGTLTFQAPRGARYTVVKGDDGIYIETGLFIIVR